VKSSDFYVHAGDVERAIGLNDRYSLNAKTALSLVDSPRYPTLSALELAVIENNLNAIENMSKLDVDVNEQDEHGMTALHLAAKISNTMAVEALLNFFASKIDVTLRNNDGNSALHIASKRGCSDIASLICDFDPNVANLKNKTGQTASDLTRSHDIYTIVQLTNEKHKLLSKYY
jgi:ankyrin repeat protein